MKKLLLILLFPLALGAQNFKHESGGVTGIESYSEGTVETDTLRTRYIRLLDGLNSDSIASYIYFDGDTSRWTGDPIKIGNNSIIVKDDTVKISNAMLTVSGQVQADTLVPYHNSTIYIRHFTVDTIEIVKYFHQQEIGVVDSMTYFAHDGDTLKIDPSISSNVIEWEDENVTKFVVDSTGRIGRGTATPLFDLSIVNSNPATNNGVHVVDSNVNKNRTTYAQATDSASAMLSTIGGNGHLRLKAIDGDSVNIHIVLDQARLKSNNYMAMTMGASQDILYWGTGSALYTGTSDAFSIGTASAKWKAVWISDNGYIGGKGQTAKLIIGTMNTMTEETDSCVVITPTAGSGSIMLASSVGSIVNFVGIQPATYTSAINQMWVNVTRDTLFIRGATGNAFYSKLTDLGSTH